MCFQNISPRVLHVFGTTKFKQIQANSKALIKNKFKLYIIIKYIVSSLLSIVNTKNYSEVEFGGKFPLKYILNENEEKTFKVWGFPFPIL